MNEAELEAERRYRVTEYLGNLIQEATPTLSQMDAANHEADRVITILREQNNNINDNHKA